MSEAGRTRRVKCNHCNGTGRDSSMGSMREDCVVCDAKGYYEEEAPPERCHCYYVCTCGRLRQQR